MDSNQELKALEVPQLSVDFLEQDSRKDLTGEQKLTLLEYLLLDDTIKELGTQRFGKTIIDNVFLEPVRKWVTENWESEFIYDLSKKAVPISFRNSLALGLFTTKITDYLNQMESVELYVTRHIQGIFEKSKLQVSSGLTQVDYKPLPIEVKRELVIPIVDNLYKAESIVKAKLLFPGGIDRKTIMLSDPGLLFELISPDKSDIIYFDSIGNLEAQATAARECIRDYVKIKTLESVVKKIEEEKKLTAPEKPEKELKPIKDSLPKFKTGTTLYDVFPYNEGEKKEDVLRAFRKIAHFYGYSYVSQSSGWEEPSVELNLDDAGKLTCVIGPGQDDFTSSSSKRNALTGRFGCKYEDELRVEAVRKLIDDLRYEIRGNKAAIQTAKAKYGKTNFIIEKGFLEVLTGKEFKETEEGKILVKEAKETVGVFEEPAKEGKNQLVVYSNRPIDERVLELDKKILESIMYSMDFDISSMLRSLLSSRRKDNLREWFGSSYSLLSQFRGIMIDASKSFNVLGIAPTNNESEAKEAYRNIVLRTHPDRTSHLVPEEILNATTTYIQATEAYQNIMARIGKHEVDVLSPTFYLGRISQLFSDFKPT
jgi:hypothetical protein